MHRMASILQAAPGCSEAAAWPVPQPWRLDKGLSSSQASGSGSSGTHLWRLIPAGWLPGAGW